MYDQDAWLVEAQYLQDTMYWMFTNDLHFAWNEKNVLSPTPAACSLLEGLMSIQLINGTLWPR